MRMVAEGWVAGVGMIVMAGVGMIVMAGVGMIVTAVKRMAAMAVKRMAVTTAAMQMAHPKTKHPTARRRKEAESTDPMPKEQGREKR